MNVATASEKVLVMRFSSFGDVAMVVPVVKSFLVEHPDKQILMLSNQLYADLFIGIERLEFLGADLAKAQKGILGIYRIYQILKKQYQISAVADLHGVLRTFILSFLLKISGKKIGAIDKGRFEKFALTRKGAKIFRQLPHSTERYLNVFKGLGFSLEGTLSELAKPMQSTASNPQIRIGFAPFAKHSAKMYSLDKFKQVVSHFNKMPYELYFFGGGSAEKRFIEEWENIFDHAVKMTVELSLKEELELMKTMNVMVTMDSANMHLASLVDVPVVSVWGATHPYAGFYGFNQNPLNAVQVNLSCRPCSVFGNDPCWRGDNACMKQITPEMIIDRVESLLV
jgi:ADP-heptose:LPS heptosyltransferase